MTVEYPPAGRAWYMVILLTALYMLSFLDRTIIVLLVEPIKADLGLTDTELSLLYGLAFAVFYTFLGIPIARLADRKSRRVIIMVGVSIWSLATAVCGLAKNFGQLFAARVSVGVGEASLSPAAYSMISDSFPTEQRAAAMSVYTMGLYLGVGFALILGGVVIDWVGEGTLTEVPVLGLLAPWQLTFMIVGLPGLLLALMMLTVTEPARRQSTAETSNISLTYAFKWFAVRWRFFIVFWLALTCLVFHSYSFS
ncbi:MAG: MFS transporter, partial [Pseudomonadales bacterium]|nr:MFS transporter [Pseudomonadales bacterium]